MAQEQRSSSTKTPDSRGVSQEQSPAAPTPESKSETEEQRRGSAQTSDSKGSTGEQAPKSVQAPESRSEEKQRSTAPEMLEVNENDPVALEKYLKEKYNVTFSGDNEVYGGPASDATYGNTLVSRRPTLTEMQVAKSAVERFGLIDKKEGMKFVYAGLPIVNQAGLTSSLNDINAFYSKGHIFFPPDYRFEKVTGLNGKRMIGQSAKWFLKDTKGQYRQQNLSAAENMSIEGNILHELGHSIDERRDPVAWKKDLRAADLGQRFGIRQVAGQNAVEGRQNDWFIHNPDRSWTHYNQFGQATANVSFDQMSAMAKIPPGTIYWTSPHEASADVKTALYTKSRESVLKRSEPAYRAAVLADQQDIDFVYGKDATGNSLRMRANNGYVVARTEANLNTLDPIARQIIMTRR